MKYVRCKCGKRTAWTSDSVPACRGCTECGMTLASHPDCHQRTEEHQWSLRYSETTGELSHKVCEVCHERSDLEQADQPHWMRDPVALDEQIAEVKTKWPGAEIGNEPVSVTHLGTGRLIMVPDIPLPSGWNKSHTRIWFLVPHSFPYVHPLRFCAEADLALSHGGPPMHSDRITLPNGERALAFYWRIRDDGWDKLTTLRQYVSAMQARFSHSYKVYGDEEGEDYEVCPC